MLIDILVGRIGWSDYVAKWPRRCPVLDGLMSRQGHRLPYAPLTDPGVRLARTGLLKLTRGVSLAGRFASVDRSLFDPSI